MINITNDLNLTNIIGDTALHFACKFRNNVAILPLLEVGTDINITNNDNETAYGLADEEGKTIIDDFLNSK